MATISNPNDPNRDANKPVVTTTASAAPSSQQQATPAAASPQYSTLQKYLGANQDAGTRLGQQIGQNVSAASKAAEKTSSREIDEASQANQAYQGNITAAKDFTTKLQAPPIVQQNPVIPAQTEQVATNPGPSKGLPVATGQNVKTNPLSALWSGNKGYDVSQYSTNVAGLDAAKQISSNANELNKLRSLASGTAFTEQKAKSDKEITDALNAAEKEKQRNIEQQQKVSTEEGRVALLDQLFNKNPSYRSGLKQLDQAFLQQDKNKTLDTVSNQLKQNMASVAERNKKAQDAFNLLGNLVQEGKTSQTALDAQTKAINDAYRADLQNRIGQVNTAKDQRLEYLKNQFKDLQQNNQIRQDAAESFGLTPEVLQSLLTDPKAVNSFANSPTTGTSGVRLFNTIKDMGSINDILSKDRGFILEDRANSLADVVNTGDIQNLDALAAIAGLQNDLNQQSRFVGEQTGISRLPELLQARNKLFNENDLKQNFQFDTGDKYATVDMLPNQVNPFRPNNPDFMGVPSQQFEHASAGASANLNDYLYGDGIFRELQNYGTTRGSGLASPDAILNQQSDLARGTEQQAVAGVQNQINNYLNNIGYQNLLRILGGS